MIVFRMPRRARIDIAGVLQHVIVRGIEKRGIFLDDEDRGVFLARLSKLLQETKTDCLAWSLMTNHFHLLLRPTNLKLALLMRRLLTAYAVTFNLRHLRAGHLFQNRYKSIVCEEEPYLLELVRYIHLNPVRAGLVKDVAALDNYPWSGHATIMGNRQFAGQAMDEVLKHFGAGITEARHNYRIFVMEGAAHGRREELVGGGMRHSLKTGAARTDDEFDERILGSGTFVKKVRQEAVPHERSPLSIPIQHLAALVAEEFEIEVDDLRSRKRTKELVDARGALCFLAVSMEHSGEEVGRMMNVSRSGVSVAARRGEKIVEKRKKLQKLVP